MASLYVPRLTETGVAATYVSASACHLRGPSLVAFCSVDHLARESALAEVAAEMGMRVLQRIDVRTRRAVGRMLVFDFKDNLDTLELWARVGVDPRTLDSIRLTEADLGQQRLKFMSALGLRREALDPRVIGMNRYGCEVFETPLGRVGVHRLKGQVRREWEAEAQAGGAGVRDFFYRAETDEDLAGCAKGAVRMMMEGVQFRRPEFTRLYEAAVAPELRSRMTLNDWHEQVEGQCVASLTRLVEAGHSARHMAHLLDMRLPVRDSRSLETSRFDQFSTPLPVAAAAATIVAPTADDTMLEPMVGNGVLASVAAALGAQITGCELEPKRAQRAMTVLGGSAEIFAGPFETWHRENADRRFDVVLANPPFSTDYQPRTITDGHGRKYKLSRADHFYAHEALAHMKDAGRAFIILAGDFISEGRLDGTRREFDNILRSSYEIAGAAVLDGRLYRKMGTTFPVQLYAVGPRREVPLTLAQTEEIAPAEVPVLRTADELDAWAEHTRDVMAALVRASNPNVLAPPSLRTDLQLSAPPERPLQRWDDRVNARTTSEAFEAFKALKVVQLADGSAARIEPSAAGWVLVVRDAAGNFTTRGDDMSGSGWTRDNALAAGIELFFRNQQALELAQPSEPVAPVVAPSQGAEEEQDARATATGAPSAETEPAPRPPRRRGDGAPGRGRRAASTSEAGADQQPARTEPVAPLPPAPIEQPGSKPATLDGILAALPKTVVPAEVVEEDDPFLLPYDPMSKIGEPSTRVQRSLATPTAQALADVERRYGSIDELVAARFAIPTSLLGARYSPEQIDALGLSISALERGLGFCNADLMGVGKGRFLAGHMQRGLLMDRPVIFLTERPDLFQDMLGRDLCDVTGWAPAELPAHIRPFIWNNSREALVFAPENGEGEPAKLLFGHDHLAASLAKEKRAISSDFNLVLATHSQFSAKGGEAKMEAITNWVLAHDRPPVLEIDEAHIVAGEASRCGRLVSDLVELVKSRGGDVIYSSATPLKSLKNIRVYRPILPDVGMSTSELLELVESNPLAMQEALSYEMVRAGTLLSREMDQNGVIREFVSLSDINPEKYERLRGKIDRFAEFLSELMEKSGEVKRSADLIERALQTDERQTHPERVNPEGNLLSMVQVNMNSPASRFHTISQYLLFALNAAFTRDLVLQEIAHGRKPIVVVSNVGDSMVEYMTSSPDQADEDQDLPPSIGSMVKRMPDIGDLLVRTADAMLTVSSRNGWGVVERTRLEEHETWLADFTDRVAAVGFDELSTSAIDKIREALAASEIRVDELTRRKYELTPVEGGVEVNTRRRASTQDIVRSFNAGDLDALVINRSASSGISLHASPRNGPDLRPRSMIKLQFQDQITHERQLEGRIHRTGQVAPGRYIVPMPGLAAGDRLAAMYNGKNRSMSSASHASRDNASNIDAAPDILNALGDKVVFAFLRNNPVLAERFGLEIRDGEHLGLARKFLGRMIILRAADQASIMAEIETNFRLMVADLEARGENPLKLNRYEWGATVEPVKTLIGGDNTADAAAQKPLVLYKVSFQEKIRPTRWDRVLQLVETAKKRWSPNGRLVTIDEELPELAKIRETGQLDWSASLFDRVLNRDAAMGGLGLEAVSSEQAAQIYALRGDEKELTGLKKAIVEAGDRAHFLAGIMPRLSLGNPVGLNPEVMPMLRNLHFFSHWSEGHDSDALLLPAVVKQVSFDKNRPLNLGEWEVELLIPGEKGAFTTSLAQVMGLERSARDQSEEQREKDPEYIEPALGLSFIFPAVTMIRQLEQGYDADHRAELMDIRQNDALTFEEQLEAMCRSFFERIPAGDITRHRYTLEDNIFQAVALSTRKKLGEKIIYTTENGQIRHAIMLKNIKIGKLHEKIDAALSARSVLIPRNAKLLQKLTAMPRVLSAFHQQRNIVRSNQSVYDKHLKQYGKDYADRHSGYALSQAKEHLGKNARDLVEHLVGVMGAQGGEPVPVEVTGLLENEATLETKAAQMTEAILAVARAPAVIAVGVGFSDDLPEPPVTIGRRLDGSLDLPNDLSRDGVIGVGRATASERNGAVIVTSSLHTFVVTHAKGSVVASVPDADYGFQPFPRRLPAGIVLGLCKSVAPFEQMVEHASEHQLDIAAYGALRAIYESAQDIRRELAAEKVPAADSSAEATPSPLTAAI